MNKKTNTGLKIICLNRKASFNYFFEDLLEAGIVLKGSEIKSIRDGKVNIAESYAIEKNGELILINSHIASSLSELGSKAPKGKRGLEPPGSRKRLRRSSQIASASLYHHPA